MEMKFHSVIFEECYKTQSKHKTRIITTCLSSFVQCHHSFLELLMQFSAFTSNQPCWAKKPIFQWFRYFVLARYCTGLLLFQESKKVECENQVFFCSPV